MSEFDSVKFTKKPKPIDMSALKKYVFRSLSIELGLDVRIFKAFRQFRK